MKTTFTILLLGILTSIAQPNLAISFTNSSGLFVTNAEVVKILPNKIIYRTSAGGGTIPISKLPAGFQKQIGFDANAAVAADEVDKKNQMIDRRRQIAEQRQAQLAADREKIKNRISAQGVQMSCNVIQKLKDGLLVSWPGTTDLSEPSVTILLVDYPKFDSTASEDDLLVSKIYPVGLFTYNTVNGSEKTVRKWTCNLDRAVDAVLGK